ncbi:MAG: hypothetical protein U0836_11730 [Pirellulales bacterium]
MSSARLPRLIRAALAACLAVVTTMPPAMGHAHAGGDRPHQHAHDHDGQRHAATESQQPAIAAAGWASNGAGRFAHVHFAWLGLEVTFAWPVGSSSSGDGQAEHIVVRLLDSAAHSDGQIDVQSPLAPVGPWLCPVNTSCGLGASCPAELRAAQTRAPASVLLCDAARHERSGVLLG